MFYMLVYTIVCFAFQDKRMTHYDIMVYDITHYDVMVYDIHALYVSRNVIRTR